MFNYFYYSYYYQLPFFLNSIFSFFLIVFLGIITPYIIILANKNEDYKKKKIFIIYEKAISILFSLHIVLTLITLMSILINIFTAYFRWYFIIIITLIIGGVGIAIIYGIYYILDKNNIAIDKSIISKIHYTIVYIKKGIKTIFSIIIPIIVPIAIPICILIFVFSDSEIFNENFNSELAIFCLVFILIFIVIMINSMIAIINQKLNKINKNIENNKKASPSEIETTKKDKNGNDYMI